MLVDIVNLNYANLKPQLLIVFLCWIIVLISVIIDFYFGVQKSRANGQKYIHSFGIRQSGSKLAQYYAVMAFMLFLDVLNPFWIYSSLQSLPIFSIVGCAIWVWTERKSVMEKFEDKVRDDFIYNKKDLMRVVRELRKELRETTSDLADIRDNEERIKKE